MAHPAPEQDARKHGRLARSPRAGEHRGAFDTAPPHNLSEYEQHKEGKGYVRELHQKRDELARAGAAQGDKRQRDHHQG